MSSAKCRRIIAELAADIWAALDDPQASGNGWMLARSAGSGLKIGLCFVHSPCLCSEMRLAGPFMRSARPWKSRDVTPPRAVRS